MLLSRETYKMFGLSVKDIEAICDTRLKDSRFRSPMLGDFYFKTGSVDKIMLDDNTKILNVKIYEKCNFDQ